MEKMSAEGNRIIFQGSFDGTDVRFACRHLHRRITIKGYRDVVLDFSQCARVAESFMVPMLPIIRNYQMDKVDFTLKLPERQEQLAVRNIFHNANWAHHIDPANHSESTYEGRKHVPAIQFRSPDEQTHAKDQVMEILLASLTNLNRRQVNALEWSLVEITDNVLQHAESRVGGFVQASTLSNTNSVEFIVSDAGMGIPKSLGIRDHQKALTEAIQEGVTKNKDTNQGNGLFGSYQAAVLSKGEFELTSQKARIVARNGDKVKSQNSPIPYVGTYVRCVINCDDSDLLKQALVFDGKPHEPAADYLEKKHEDEGSGDMIFKVNEHKDLLNSRESGTILRNKLLNLLNMLSGNHKLRIDFEEIYVISSSVADEAFGKLFTEMGAMQFMKKVEFVHVEPTVEMLINRAIRLRMKN